MGLAMKLHNCKKCFHHVDHKGTAVTCRFWGGEYSRLISSDGVSDDVISCPRTSL